MASNVVSIPYSEELLLALREEPESFEREARLLLAVKLYELGKLSTGMVAQLAGMTRVAFMFELARYNGKCQCRRLTNKPCTALLTGDQTTRGPPCTA
jgi:predicted HTH domain antitoxin